MATYLILNIIFLCLVLLVLRLFGMLHWNKSMSWVLALLLLLTAIFDSLLVGLGIVAYDMDKILGIIIGFAPIEDFFYTIVVALMIPAIWKKLGSRYV